MPSAIVLDASVLGEFVLDPSSNPSLDELIRSEGCEIFIPHLCDVEVASGFRSRIARGAMEAARASEALEHFVGLPLHRVGHVPLLSRVLSLRDNFSAYDATYVALAESLGAPLYTADLRLARAVREHTEVDVVEV